MKNMKRNTLLLIVSLLVSASLLTACAGAIPASSWSGITADQDIAYLAQNAHIYAVNIKTQQELWRFPSKAENGLTFFAPPVLTADNQLIAGSYGPGGYNLYSLNPANGAQNWTFDQAKNHYIASPLVTEDRIYAPNSDGKLYALDLKGNLQWTFTSEEPLWASPAVNDLCTCLFVPSMDHTLISLDAATGKVRWQTGDLGGAIVSSPTFAEDGTIYVGTFASEVISLSADKGEILWRFQTNGFVWSQPNLVDGVLYFGDSKGTLYAVNTDGAEVWNLKTAGPIVTTPFVQDETIFITEGTDTVYAYSLDSTSIWQQKLEGQLQGAVVGSGDRLLVSPLNSQTALFVLTSAGALQWSFVPEK